MTLIELFALWPNIPAMATAVGEKPSTVAKWKFRNSIPVDYWKAAITAAAGKGVEISAEDLLAMHTGAPTAEAACE